MNANEKNMEVESKIPRRQRLSTIIILIIACIFVFILGSIAMIEINSAFQQVSIERTANATAQAARILAVSKQEAAEAANATAQANVQKSQTQAQISRANEIAAQSAAVQSKNFVLSMLLGIEAYRKYNTVHTKSALLNNLNTNPSIQQYLSGHKNPVSTVVFSPDGNMIASASCSPGNDYRCKESIIILHDSHTGQIIHLLNTHADSVNSLVFSPDGLTLAAGGLNTTTLWDVKTGQPLSLPSGDSMLINALAFSPDGNTLATTGCSKWDMGTCVLWNIHLWDVKSRQIIGEPFMGELIKNTNIIMNVAFSPDGTTLAASSYIGSIFILDLKTHQIRETLTTRQIDGRIQFLSNETLASWGKNESSLTVMVWDLKTQQIIGEPLSLKNYTKNMGIISPDGSVFSVSTEKSGILLYDMQTHEIVGVFSSHESANNIPVFNVQAFSPDGKTLALIGQDKNAVILAKKLKVPSLIGKQLIENGADYSAYHVEFSNDSQTLVVAASNAIYLWDTQTWKQRGKAMLTDYVGNIALSPTGKILASGTCIRESGFSCQQAGIILWDTKTDQPIGEPLTILEDMIAINGQSARISSLAISPDGQILASSSTGNRKDLEIFLWDITTRKLISKLKGHTSSISKVIFSTDGSILASSSLDNTIILWDSKTGQRIGTLIDKHPGITIKSIAFSPDGSKLAAASLGSTVTLWDVKSKQPIGEPLKPNLPYTYDVAFSSDGKTLAVAGFVSSVILFDLETRQPIGEPLARSRGGGGEGMSVAFSPDGNIMAAVHSNFDDLIVWNVNPQTWVETTCQRAGRNFTRAEWAQYLPDTEYRATCPQWPIEEDPTLTP